MSNVEQKRRELFEAWFDGSEKPRVSFGNPDILKRQLWPAFNAALDTVEIELPGSFYPAEASGPCVELHDVIEAIESTNLGLKVK